VELTTDVLTDRQPLVGGATVSQSTVFTSDPVLLNIVSITATDDFTAGAPAETNTEMIARLEEGTAVQSISDRISISAKLKSEFTTLTDVSSIGVGDEESVRDTRHLLRTALGGRGDIYTRTADVPVRTRVTVLATYAGTQTELTAFGITGLFRDYTLTLNVDTVASFYRAPRLTYMNPASTESTGAFDYEFTEGATVAGYSEVSRALRTVDEPFSPNIRDPQEAVYSRYQGAVVFDIVNDLPTANYQLAFEELVEGFSDTDTIPVAIGDEVQDLTVGEIRALIADDSKRIYDIYVDVMPDINEMQDFLNDRDNRPPGADYLVKAAVPCFVGIDMTIAYSASGTVPDEADIQNAVADAVNALPIGTAALSLITLTSAVQSDLPPGTAIVSPVELIGVTRLPDGTSEIQSSTTSITIPTHADQGVSPRTAIFSLRPDDVTIQLTAI
jgi:hypothetical protein